MDIKSYNKALAEQCKKCFYFAFINSTDPEDEEISLCNDTDTVRYKVFAKKDKLTLYFFFVDLQNVWKYIEDYFRATYYKNFSIKISKTPSGAALEISLDTEGFTVLNKEMALVQQSGVMTGVSKFDPLITALSRKMASIKRHFLGSIFEKMLDAVRVNATQKGNKVQPNFSFYIKQDKKQKVWIAFEKTQVTVYYGLGFEDRFEQQLGKIFFSELVDSRKHVHNSPAVSVTQSQLPRALIESFPEQKTNKYQFSNGIVSITLFGALVKNHRSTATYLAGFRNYTYYHIQAWKCYLHARILRRLNIFQKDLQLAYIEPFAQK